MKTITIVINSIIVISIIGFFYFKFYDFNPIFHWFKPIPLLLLTLQIYRSSDDPLHRQTKYWMIFAFLLCSLGDYFIEFRSYFLQGLGSFLIGHIFFYIYFL